MTAGGAGGGVLHNPTVKGQLAPDTASRRDKGKEFKSDPPKHMKRRSCGVKSPCKELQAVLDHQVHAGRAAEPEPVHTWY